MPDTVGNIDWFLIGKPFGNEMLGDFMVICINTRVRLNPHYRAVASIYPYMVPHFFKYICQCIQVALFVPPSMNKQSIS